MSIENIRAFFLTKNADINEDVLLLCREFNLDIRFITSHNEVRGNDCDLIIADLSTIEDKEIMESIERCADGPYCLPIIYITEAEHLSRISYFLQFRPGSILTRPLNRATIYELLGRIIKNVDLKYRIQEEHQYYDALMETSIVTKTDPEGIITFANENFCKLSGYDEMELVGRPHNIVRHPDMPPEVFSDLWRTISQKKIWRGRVKNLKKGGGYYIVDAVIIPLMDEHGEIKEYMSIRNDITLIEQMHDQMLREQERKNKIMQNQKVLEEVARAKDEFLVVFTHELKTPLNAIINFSEYITKQIEKSSIDKKDRLMDLITSVRKNAANMLENIVNIIDLSKLKAGKLKLQPVLVDVAALMKDQMERFGPIIEQNRVRVTLDIQEHCLYRSDEHRLGQLISNLFSNAIKYGKGEILITAKCQEGKLLWSIEDNGPGIRDKEKIFELYEQEESNAVKRTAQGTGVGLHFVKYLCNHLGLTITVEDASKLGGAKFTLRG